LLLVLSQRIQQMLKEQSRQTLLLLLVVQLVPLPPAFQLRQTCCCDQDQPARLQD
jgi:hypothetical protein